MAPAVSRITKYPRIKWGDNPDCLEDSKVERTQVNVIHITVGVPAVDSHFGVLNKTGVM